MTVGRIAALLLVAALPGACARHAAPAPARGPGELRVLVYNIHAGKDAGGEHNLARVAALVDSTGADLVLLQEVDRGTTRSGGEDQVRELARLTGHHAAFGKTLDYQGGEYGIAVLSRWPLSADRLHRLPVEPPQERAGGSYEPRGALAATAHAPGSPVALLNTHLDPSRDEHYRLQEVATVARLADSLRAAAGLVLVGGDFNAEPGSRPIVLMLDAGWRDAWQECGAGEGGTYPASAPIKRIDYLFIPAGIECLRAEVIATATSDHRPLLVVLGRSDPPSR